jgi:hypothetical protein
MEFPERLDQCRAKIFRISSAKTTIKASEAKNAQSATLSPVVLKIF